MIASPSPLSTALHHWSRVSPADGTSPTLDEFLTRWHHHGKCSQEVYLIAAVYIRRLSELPSFPNDLSYPMLLRHVLAALVVATKQHDDVFPLNTYLAQVGGVSVAELNTLEGQLLGMLGFRSHVGADEYNFVRCEIERMTSKNVLAEP